MSKTVTHEATLIPVTELARRLCLANHRRDFDNARPSERTVPCGVHTAQARGLYFLIAPDGEKSLDVIIGLVPSSTPAVTAPADNLAWIGEDIPA